MNSFRSVLWRLGLFGTLFLVLAAVAILWFSWKFFGFGASMPHYDKILHFLGGFACGMFGLIFAVWGPFDHLCSKEKFDRRVMTLALLSTLAIGGILWESAEYFIEAMRDHLPWDAWDTLADIAVDLVGAITAIRLYQK